MSQSNTPSAPKQARKPRSKPQRFVRLGREADTGAESLVIRTVTTTGKESIDIYALLEIGTDDPNGRGFCLTKADGTKYNCEVSRSGNTCDCKGCLQHGHCKHCEGIAAMMSKGKLGGYPEPQREFLDDHFTDEQADAMAAYYDEHLDAA